MALKPIWCQRRCPPLVRYSQGLVSKCLPVPFAENHDGPSQSPPTRPGFSPAVRWPRDGADKGRRLYRWLDQGLAPQFGTSCVAFSVEGGSVMSGGDGGKVERYHEHGLTVSLAVQIGTARFQSSMVGHYGIMARNFPILSGKTPRRCTHDHAVHQ